VPVIVIEDNQKAIFDDTEPLVPARGEIQLVAAPIDKGQFVHKHQDHTD
jgi:hypothetical protein